MTHDDELLRLGWLQGYRDGLSASAQVTSETVCRLVSERLRINDELARARRENGLCEQCGSARSIWTPGGQRGEESENAKFFAATPSGKLEVQSVTTGLFVVGKEYYLDLSPAEAGAPSA